jgi:hypothetical protein
VNKIVDKVIQDLKNLDLISENAFWQMRYLKIPKYGWNI